MKNNTLTFLEYLVCSLLLDIEYYYVYRELFFKIEEGDFGLKSHLLLVIIVISVFFINYRISGSYALNLNSAVMTTFLSYGLFVFISWFQYVKPACTGIVRIALVLIVLYMLLVFGRRIKSVRNRDKIKKVRIRKAFLGARNIAAYACLACVISIFIQSHVIEGIDSTEVRATSVYGNECQMSENMDMFIYLQEEQWEKLAFDIDKKLAVLQTVVNCEGRYLSFNKKVTLYTEELEEGMLGYFNPGSSSIYIDTKQLLYGSSEKCLDIVLHECFHVSQYQYTQIYNSLSEEDKKSYFFQDAAIYANEFDNYIMGEESFEGYYTQKIETDARNYSKTACEEIMEEIENYLENQTDS